METVELSQPLEAGLVKGTGHKCSATPAPRPHARATSVGVGLEKGRMSDHVGGRKRPLPLGVIGGHEVCFSKLWQGTVPAPRERADWTGDTAKG